MAKARDQSTILFFRDAILIPRPYTQRMHIPATNYSEFKSNTGTVLLNNGNILVNLTSFSLLDIIITMMIMIVIITSSRGSSSSMCKYVLCIAAEGGGRWEKNKRLHIFLLMHIYCV